VTNALRVEWPTLLLVIATYALWAGATTWLAGFSLAIAVPVTAVLIAFHGSLTHEIVHGHPFTSRHANTALMWPTLSLCIPLFRFQDTHLDHHMDSDLTDPYDDPESNYLDPEVWERLPASTRSILRFNNTLAGRILVGPVVGQAAFLASEWRSWRAGDARVLKGWLWHVPQAGIVIAWLVWIAEMPIWAYLVAVYFGIGLLKIRTFLEHQAHEKTLARTVIIEDRGPLAFLFLMNNLHVVHHMHPKVPWYALWAKYRQGRERYMACNQSYIYRSYLEIFRKHLFRAKDPVSHPLSKA